MISSSRRGQTFPLIACGAFLALLAATPAAAQDSGTVSGTVVDASGQVVIIALVWNTYENPNPVAAASLDRVHRGDVGNVRNGAASSGGPACPPGGSPGL